MITMELIKFSFLTYIIPLFIYIKIDKERCIDGCLIMHLQLQHKDLGCIKYLNTILGCNINFVSNFSNQSTICCLTRASYC